MSRYLVAHVVTGGLNYGAQIVEAEDEREAAEQWLQHREVGGGWVYVAAVDAEAVVRFLLDVTTQRELRRKDL